MTEQATIEHLLDGDPETVEVVRSWIRGAFTPYRQRLAADLEDLEQEILLELTVSLRESRFQGGSTLRTYVRTYVCHKCIDKLRALSRREWVDVADLDLVSAAPTALDEMSSKERTTIALEVVAEMPQQCRELWAMLQEGMRYGEMSRRLGVAEGTLRARVLRCRKQALKVRQDLLARRGPKNRA